MCGMLRLLCPQMAILKNCETKLTDFFFIFYVPEHEAKIYIEGCTKNLSNVVSIRLRISHPQPSESRKAPMMNSDTITAL